MILSQHSILDHPLPYSFWRRRSGVPLWGLASETNKTRYVIRALPACACLFRFESGHLVSVGSEGGGVIYIYILIPDMKGPLGGKSGTTLGRTSFPIGEHHHSRQVSCVLRRRQPHSLSPQFPLCHLRVSG